MDAQQQLKGKRRPRHYSTPAEFEILSSNWSPEKHSSNILPSSNSIDINVDLCDDSGDNFDDIGMESNLSANSNKKGTSIWLRPFMVNNIFM